ncbi:MAG: hypothetical protein ACREXR_11925, partial [Gammaproteobacteria bacterium]
MRQLLAIVISLISAPAGAAAHAAVPAYNADNPMVLYSQAEPSQSIPYNPKVVGISGAVQAGVGTGPISMPTT